ncbi:MULTISPECIES: PAS domain S-box protein [unclassified Mucilaginibacter]|uniref:PAS domain S-box protein n=1 Tax=unclassified Mucilaginibacter TaxID=2617802 RepID=UPI00095A1535|nr:MULTISPECIES: PAS domain S-box protein [unclassified Mucilaginibacter]OJW13292.1 MAG: hypothetical protein BGO48_00590 [Mucilaginibacter sp. 44-25]PLW88562.1 MAG: hypothetical protein C0154_15975 [Mucilaginibacter sp.]HEK20128.1 PAS domain S-box protein [Bacteroidota bacterium]
MKRIPISNFLEKSQLFYTIIIGLDGTYMYVSPSYDQNFGANKGSLNGQNFSVTLHPDDIAICEEIGTLCLTHPEKSFPFTLRKLDGKGGYVITKWEIQALPDDQGKPVGIFCVGFNITTYMDTQEKLDQAASELDDISYMQSHGVRKPLANIMGLADLLNEAEDPAHYKRIILMLQQSAAELDDIIKEISNKRI